MASERRVPPKTGRNIGRAVGSRLRQEKDPAVKSKFNQPGPPVRRVEVEVTVGLTGPITGTRLSSAHAAIDYYASAGLSDSVTVSPPVRIREVAVSSPLEDPNPDYSVEGTNHLHYYADAALSDSSSTESIRVREVSVDQDNLEQDVPDPEPSDLGVDVHYYADTALSDSVTSLSYRVRSVSADPGVREVIEARAEGDVVSIDYYADAALSDSSSTAETRVSEGSRGR